jgi:hypothetical protein
MASPTRWILAGFPSRTPVISIKGRFALAVMLTPEGLKQVVYTGTSISCAALFYGMPLAGR